MVYVSDGNPIIAPYIETFEDTAEVSANWTSLNYDNNNTLFQWYKLGHYSNGSYRLNEYDGTYAGDRDELVSRAVDLTNLSGTQATLTFEYSFATFDASHVGDSIASLAVLASADCGNTWRPLYYNAGGYNLYNAGAVSTGAFIPLSTDQYWKQVTVNIPNNLLSSTVNFKFQLLSAYQANHFYIDNVNIGQATMTGINNVKVSPIDAINIIPNPTSGPAAIILDASAATNVTVTLYDMTGREVSTIYQGLIETGGRKIDFDANNVSSGVYTIKVSDGKTNIQRRFVKM